MNQVTEEKKESLTKTFAIVGFVAIILFTVWLAVQIVTVIPSAFSSLASLADSVYNYDNAQELVVVSNDSVINAGESFTITWTDMQNDGNYSFSYACTEGVAVDAKDSTGNIISLSCDTPLLLNEKTSLDLLIASEKFRFVDVPYTISFIGKGATGKTLATTKAITIVNASIPTGANLAEEPVVEETTPIVATPTNTVTPPAKTPTYTAGTPIVTKKIIYTIPVSDPKGDTDLAVTFLGIGTLNGKVFIPTKNISVNENGAVQFEIKNIGTKTSDDWSYEVNLPSDITFSSDTQKPLKPNERAVITLGFEGISKVGTEKITVEVTAKNDIKKSNNDFTWAVTFVK